MVGQQVGQYRILERLGEGGTGEVYTAVHQLIGRRAAVKFLRKEVSTEGNIISRFIEEARAVNGIRHPNIVDITDFGEHDGRHFLVMELLEGETVADAIEREGHFDELTAADIAHQVSSALAAAHEAGFVHRDIKPENLFLTNHPDRPRFVKVLDFGIAKLTNEVDGPKRQTVTGTVLGTPTYMSPEQCLGQADIDGRSDIYSLGCVLYEMVVGHPPFDEPTLGSLIVAHCHDQPVPPRDLNGQISQLMNRTILQALAKKRDDRFFDIVEMRQRLRVLALRTGFQHNAPEEEEEEEEKAPEPAQEELPKVKGNEPTIQAKASDKPTFFQRRRLKKKGRRYAGGARSKDVDTVENKSERVSHRLTSIVRDRIANRRFVLPAMPDVVVAALARLEDPKFNFDDIAEVLARDPLIAAQVLKVANSVAFAGVQKATTLPHAVSRIGGRYLKVVLLELAARQVFHSRNPMIRKSLEGIWIHSRATSLLARELAESVEASIDVEVVALAGLLHDAGKPMAAGLLLEAERQLASQEKEFMSHDVWVHVVNQCHREVAVAVARAWKLPAEVQLTIDRCGTYNTEDVSALVNFVTLANAIAKREFPYPGDIDAEEIASQVFAGTMILGLDDEMIDAHVEALRERLEETESK